LNGSMRGRASAEALTNRLFALLDADKDGKLSPQEAGAAAAVLAGQDRDEDEVVSADELAGNRRSEASGELAAVFTLAGAGAAGGVSDRFVLLGEAKADRALARRLRDRYGKGGEKRLDAGAVGLRGLDRDEDGLLDLEELARLGQARPEVEL